MWESVTVVPGGEMVAGDLCKAGRTQKEDDFKSYVF